MKKSFLLLSLTALVLTSGSASLASTYKKGWYPVAEKIIGQEADPELHCTIYEGNTVIKRKGKADKTVKKGPGAKYDVVINGARAEKITTSLHMREQVPNIYYGALYDVGAGPEQVLLLKDASRLQSRVGINARELIKLIDQFCPAK